MTLQLYIKAVLTVLLLVTGIAPVSPQKHRGKASFYSKKATGARTSSGERIHHDSLTCAHRTYPFGTILKVTNLSNGKSVNVRVIDRGPFGKGRIIDLSYGAAKALGMLSQGVAMVEVERVSLMIPNRDEPVEMGLPDFDFDINELGSSLVKPFNIEDLKVTSKKPKKNDKKKR